MNSILSLERSSVTHPANVSTSGGDAVLTTHEHIGFELGWDYAHYRVEPPAPYGRQSSALRHGLLAGQAAFGKRCLAASPEVRQWLHLRLNAWLRGRSVELFQVTPRYLQQIETRFCPITRVELSNSTARDSDVSIDRVRNDAGYAAGNLAMMSTRANQAKGAHGFADAMVVVRQLADRPLLEVGGLGAAAWRRIAILCSFLEPIPHADACSLPLLVCPPRRLHLFNPVQALQLVISGQLLRPGWSKRSSAFEALLEGTAQRRAYQAFFHTLLPRVLEAVAPPVRQARTEHDLQQIRWAIEDAWCDRQVMRCWSAFARLLDAQTCEWLLAQIDQRKLAPLRSANFSDAQATEGWNLPSRGYVPHAVLMRRTPVRKRPVATEQGCLAL